MVIKRIHIPRIQKRRKNVVKPKSVKIVKKIPIRLITRKFPALLPIFPIRRIHVRNNNRGNETYLNRGNETYLTKQDRKNIYSYPSARPISVPTKRLSPLKKNLVTILNSYISPYDMYPKRVRRIRPLKQRCFIIGNGPSIRGVDLSLLKNEVTIACNYFMIDKTQLKGFSPTILCAGDRTCSLHILTRDVPKIQTANEPIVVIHPTHPYLLTTNNLAIKQKAIKNYYSYQHIYSFQRMKNFTLTKGLISTDQFVRNYKEHCILYRNVIPMISMHIAEKLGFREIYLLGCDFDNFLKHFYKVKTNVNPRYLKKNYDAAYNGFVRKKKVLAKKNIKVFNCNPKSKLDMFPFVNLTDVLKS